MGPLDLDVDYSDVVIATRATDKIEQDGPTGWAIYSRFTVLFLSAIGTVIGATFVIGILLSLIGWIVSGSVIGLLGWACQRYGTNDSIFDRFRYRTDPIQRAKIARRLSGGKKISI